MLSRLDTVLSQFVSATKFAFANLKILVAKVLNYEIVICLLWLWLLSLLSISVILVLQSVFSTRPLLSGILFFNSNFSVSYLVFKINALVSILFTLATNLSYEVF